jgi:hypothetical protein
VLAGVAVQMAVGGGGFMRALLWVMVLQVLVSVLLLWALQGILQCGGTFALRAPLSCT